ncbi:Cupin domain-containing protein [Reichenbachiella faecimaris]|uniref:Cupin domain-containing protein n=2 Tax=Reichenbachiella faecimaris TaxID=692418 RepID=A0A1W2G6H8_REIFA|nr:Cupin domain-containing protein [Reichenbachiella faecimaris]
MVFAFFALMDQSWAQEPSSDPLDISRCVNTYDPEKASPTKVGHQFWFVNKESLDGRTLKLSAVGPGMATHPPHQHAEDEFFFVLEGTAEFFLNGETRIVQPYTTLYCPSQSLHGIKNAGDTELKYLVIKKYNLTK